MESGIAALNSSCACLERVVALPDDTAPGGWLLVDPREPPTAAQDSPLPLPDELDGEWETLLPRGGPASGDT